MCVCQSTQSAIGMTRRCVIHRFMTAVSASCCEAGQPALVYHSLSLTRAIALQMASSSSVNPGALAELSGATAASHGGSSVDVDLASQHLASVLEAPNPSGQPQCLTVDGQPHPVAATPTTTEQIGRGIADGSLDQHECGIASPSTPTSDAGIVCCGRDGQVRVQTIKLDNPRTAPRQSSQTSPCSSPRTGTSVQPEGNLIGAQPLGDVLWSRDPVWQGHVGALVNFPAGLSVLELCAGASTASIALRLLLGDGQMRLAGAWDIAEGLQPIFDIVHGPSEHVHLGPHRGNIMTQPLDSFPSANLVVAGPPCPPFSACGNRKALSDPRARPFERCVDIIAELDNRKRTRPSDPELMFFVLENVVGICHKAAGATTSPLDTILDILSQRMGPEWSVQTIRVNTKDYGLPQNRERMYIIGRRANFYTEGHPSMPPRFMFTLSPKDFLERGHPTCVRRTELQQQCLDGWREVLRDRMVNPAMRGSVAFLEVGRDPTDRTSWGSKAIKENRCFCLRASGPHIHVLALGEGLGQLSLDRRLLISERASLQGFPPAIGQLCFKEPTGMRIYGNAMSVPVLGSCLAMELQCLLLSNSGSRLKRAILGHSAAELLVPEPSPSITQPSLVPAEKRQRRDPASPEWSTQLPPGETSTPCHVGHLVASFGHDVDTTMEKDTLGEPR